MRPGLSCLLSAARIALASPVVLFTVTTAPLAMAAEGEPNAEAPTATIIVAGDDAEIAVLRAGVAEQLDRLGVRADVTRERAVRPQDVVAAEEGGPDMVARVWIDFSAPDEAILYVADRSGSRVLVRRFPRKGRIEIAREAALAALQTAVDALLHGGLIGVSRDEARAVLGLGDPEPAPEPAAEPTPPPRPKPVKPPPPRPVETTLGLGVAYEIGGYSDRSIEHGPLIALSLTRPFGRRVLGIVATGQYRFPMQATSAPVTMRLESGALRVAAVGDVLRAWPFDVRAMLGGGVDIARADPDLLNVVDATLTPISRVDPVFRGGITGRAPLGLVSRASLELTLGVDIAPLVKPYAVARGEDQTLLLAPWTVRPLLVLGLAVP